MIGRSYDRAGVFSAMAAAMCWGVSATMSKTALATISPASLLVFQLAASIAVLWIAVWWQRPTAVPSSGIIKFAWLGLLEPGLAYLLGLIGLTDTGAGSSTLIQSSESIMIVILSAVLFRDRPSGRFVVLSLFAFGGLLIALGILNPTETGGNGPLGILLIFLGTASAAIYVVLSSRFAVRADPIVIVAWQQTVALVFALAILPVQSVIHPQTELFPATFGMWLLVAASGIVQYALAFSLYMRALKTVNVNLAGAFLNLIPVFGLVGAFIFLHEELSFLQMIGAMSTIAAVMTISLERKSATD